VSSVASVIPSDSVQAKACCKWSTTHGPLCKEVVVITLLPTHWPEKPVVGLLNSYLNSHGRAIHAVSKTQNHLGGLALVCDVVPVEDHIQVMHVYFITAAKRLCGEDTIEMQVEVGLSKSFLCIPDSCTLAPACHTTPRASPFQSLLRRLRRFSLPPNGKTLYICTRGLCLVR
jgi:hypothetical protein